MFYLFISTGESIPKLLDKIQRASTIWMDRWSIEVKNNPTCEDQLPHPKVSQLVAFSLNFCFILIIMLFIMFM